MQPAPEWRAGSERIVEALIRDKFRRNAKAREVLLGTGRVKLVYTNSHDDRVWGVCGGEKAAAAAFVRHGASHLGAWYTRSSHCAWFSLSRESSTSTAFATCYVERWRKQRRGRFSSPQAFFLLILRRFIDRFMVTGRQDECR